MEIRKAVKEDAPRIHKLLCDIARLHTEGNPDVFEGKSAKYDVTDVEKMISDGSSIILSALEEGNVIGYLICKENITEADGLRRYRRTLYIDDLCVDENARGIGAGKALFNEAKKLAFELGCSALDLNVWSFNKNAIAFYEKMGMTDVRRHMEMKL